MPLVHKIIPIRNDNRPADRIFIEKDSTGKVGKILGIAQLSKNSEESVLYSVHDIFTGQCISPREATFVEDFNRYMQAGQLQWR